MTIETPTDLEFKARRGHDGETKAAVREFLTAFESFKEANDQRLSALETTKRDDVVLIDAAILALLLGALLLGLASAVMAAAHARYPLAPPGKDRVAALAAGKIVAIGPMSEVLASSHPWVQAYFRGARGLKRAEAATNRS